MVKKALSGDFNPDRAAFFMPSGAGPCRFGQYNILHRFVLDEIGLSHVPVFSPNQDESLYRELGIIGSDFTKQAWKGIMAIEMLIKCLHETRPYEINKGETDALYKKYLSEIVGTIKSRNGAFPELLEEMRNRFAAIPRRDERRPLIGVIGEIFVRHNSFANENVIRKIETMGGEVWLAPVEEWLYYINSMGLRRSLIKLRNKAFSKNNLNEFLSIVITRLYQNRIEHKFSRPFEGFLKTLKEPPTREILKNAAPYLHDSFEGEAVLSIGKAIDFVKRGASGIINAMPFGCMPGTIVSALLKGLKHETGIPCLSIAYDGAEATCSEIQLETFMHQAYEYNNKKFK
jgi:predicted nucleotide-binding protein (sugar kinase/HSP70/actin superfamily)